MTCEEARSQALDFTRRRLVPAVHDAIAAHVDLCAACRSLVESERAMDELLAQRLQRYDAPASLKRRLEALVRPPAAATTSAAALPARIRTRWSRLAAPLAVAAAIALVAGGTLLQRSPGRGALALLTSEVVTDHLRVLARQRPVDVESGGTHQVKPWFEGKLDFAPVVPALEGTEARLRGGAIGYVFDRKAAVLVYQLRLHVVTLLVFPDERLAWPDDGARRLGPIRGHAASSRGFHAILWRKDGLAYALVSDADESELGAIAARAAAETTGGQAP